MFQITIGELCGKKKGSAALCCFVVPKQDKEVQGWGEAG